MSVMGWTTSAAAVGEEPPKQEEDRPHLAEPEEKAPFDERCLAFGNRGQGFAAGAFGSLNDFEANLLDLFGEFELGGFEFGADLLDFEPNLLDFFG
ncbi:hypothetical protein [Hydrogenophilus thermoluteolus]|uniref:hypothetical protein n=1 Tax=Hydrogenophilus thermoluteolus TaxID=297 RepID=UPI003F67E08B